MPTQTQIGRKTGNCLYSQPRLRQTTALKFLVYSPEVSKVSYTQSSIRQQVRHAAVSLNFHFACFKNSLNIKLSKNWNFSAMADTFIKIADSLEKLATMEKDKELQKYMLKVSFTKISLF